MKKGMAESVRHAGGLPLSTFGVEYTGLNVFREGRGGASGMDAFGCPDRKKGGEGAGHSVCGEVLGEAPMLSFAALEAKRGEGGVTTSSKTSAGGGGRIRLSCIIGVNILSWA